MSTKRNPHDTILQHFTTAPLGEARLLFNLVKAAMKRRDNEDQPTSVKGNGFKVKVKRAKRAKKSLTPAAGVEVASQHDVV